MFLGIFDCSHQRAKFKFRKEKINVDIIDIIKIIKANDKISLNTRRHRINLQIELGETIWRLLLDKIP